MMLAKHGPRIGIMDGAVVVKHNEVLSLVAFRSERFERTHGDRERSYVSASTAKPTIQPTVTRIGV